MLTRLFETIKEMNLFINFNWSPIVKNGVGNNIGIWLGVKFKNLSTSTPLPKAEEEILSVKTSKTDTSKAIEIHDINKNSKQLK